MKSESPTNRKEGKKDMKKMKLTPAMVERLQLTMRIRVDNEKDYPGSISKTFKQLDEFLKLAYDLYLIEDYDEVAKITKAVGEAGMDELEILRKRETA